MKYQLRVMKKRGLRVPLCAASSPLTPSPTIIVFLTHGTNQSKENKLPFTRCCLLLLSLLLLSLLPSPLLTLALVALVGALVAQLAESTTLDRLGQLGLLDLGNGRGDGGNGEGGTGREDGVLNGLEVLLGGVGLLGLVRLLGEENEAGGVGLQALYVGSERLLGEVLAAGVDRDADGRGVLAGDAGGLKRKFLLVFGIQPNARFDLPTCRVSVHEISWSLSGLSPPKGVAGTQCTFSSARVKPRPARTRRLYLIEEHRTTGRSLSTGRGATAAALA